MPITNEEREKILKDQEEFIDRMEAGFAEGERKEKEVATRVKTMESTFERKKIVWENDKRDIDDRRDAYQKALGILKITPEERWLLKRPQVEATLHSFREACNKASAHNR